MLVVEYRDDTPFVGDNHTSAELANAIRTKKYGKDVREPIAQLADKLDSAIKGQNIGSVVATPTKVFANLSALQSAYPNGADGVMVTADTGHKYFWQNNAWVDGGVYQSVINPYEISSAANLVGFGMRFDSSSGVTGAKQYYWHSEERKLKFVTDYTSPSDYTDVTVDKENAIVSYNGITFKINHNGDFELINGFLTLVGAGTIMEGDTGVTGPGQFYFHSGLKEVRLVTYFRSKKSFDDVKIVGNSIPVSLFDEKFYIKDGKFFIQKKELTLTGLGLMGDGSSKVSKIGDFYWHTDDEKLDYVVDFASAKNFKSLQIEAETEIYVTIDNKPWKIEKNTIYPTYPVKIEGVGYLYNGTSCVTSSGQFYINRTDMILRYVYEYESETVFKDYKISKKYIRVILGGLEFQLTDNRLQPMSPIIDIIGIGYDNLVTDKGQWFWHENNKDLEVSTGFYQNKLIKYSLDLPSVMMSYRGILLNGVRGEGFYELKPKQEISNLFDSLAAITKGNELANDLNNHLIDFAKPGDLMVHVSTIDIVNNKMYCTYYANTETAAEDPTKHIARFAFCNLNTKTDIKYFDLQRTGDEFDGHVVTKIYDTIMMRKDQSVIYLMWTAELENVGYVRLYKTFDIQNETFSDIKYNYLKVGTETRMMSDTNIDAMITPVKFGAMRTSGDIGIMQKISYRIENGEKFFYTGLYSGSFVAVIKSKDFETWELVTIPPIVGQVWENAVYVIGGNLFYAQRLKNGQQGCLLSYNITNDTWSEPSYFSDSGSRCDFFYKNGQLYLVYAPGDRNHIGIINVNTDDLSKSKEVSIATVPDYFYPYVLVSDETYMSFTQSRKHIYISKFNL